MDWSRVKNILICLLLAVNAFLLYNTIKNENERIYISKETIKDTEDILTRLGISLDTNIPRKRPKLWLWSVSDSGQILFDDSSPQTFQNKMAATSEKQVVSAIKKFFKKNNINTNTNGYNIDEIIFEDNIQAVCSQTIGGYELYGHYLNITIMDDIISCSGKWIFNGFVKLNQVKPKDITSILLKYAQKKSPEIKTEIKSISIIYIEETDSGEYSPVWEIIDNTGEYYYDALSGNEFYIITDSGIPTAQWRR